MADLRRSMRHHGVGGLRHSRSLTAFQTVVCALVLLQALPTLLSQAPAWVGGARPTGRRVSVQMAATKVASVVEQLKARGALSSAVQVVPFLTAEQRNEFAYLVPEAAPATEPMSPDLMPAVGDSVKELWPKLQQLKRDEDVALFRSKLDQKVRQALQEKIEVEQAMTAEALATLEYADEEAATQAWEIFGKQYPKAVENGKFMTTPTKESDIKFRWRRLKELMEIDSETALEIVSKDAAPLFVDPDFIRRSWTAIVANLDGGRQEALSDLVMKHPGILISDASLIKNQLAQAKLTAAMVDLSRGIFNFARSNIFDNGRKVPINRRETAPFGGGFPAWRRAWEEEMKKREELAKANQKS